MGKVVLAKHLSKDEAFEIECPQCHDSEFLSIRDVSSSSHSLQRKCPCGAAFTVRLVGFRRFQRKSVKLPASFVSLGNPVRIKMLCEVLDISVGGMRFVTEAEECLAVGDKVSIILILDDEHRSRLQLQGTVKRVTPAQGQVSVAVEFIPLQPPERDILQAYTPP